MTSGRNPSLAGLIVAFMLAMAVVAVYYANRPRVRTPDRRIRCRNNLNHLAKGMAMYLYEFGDGRWYPCPLGRGLEPDSYNGAEWLASLYWTRVTRDPGVYICPSSRDTNSDGGDLGTDRAVPGRFGSRTVSYAGMHYYSLSDGSGSPRAGAIDDSFPPDEPMACDDTEGPVHHGTPREGGMNVLFFDSHVEFWTQEKIDLERGVGMKGGPLWRLRN